MRPSPTQARPPPASPLAVAARRTLPPSVGRASRPNQHTAHPSIRGAGPATVDPALSPQPKQRPPSRATPTNPTTTPTQTDRVAATRLRCHEAPPDGKRRPARGTPVPEMRAPPQLSIGWAALTHSWPARRLDPAPPSHPPPPRRAAGRRAPSAAVTAHTGRGSVTSTAMAILARIALVATVPARAGRWQPFWKRLCGSSRPACASTTQPGLRGGKRRGGPA